MTAILEIFEKQPSGYRSDPSYLKIKNWFMNNAQFIVVSVVAAGLLTWIFSLYVSNNREIGEHKIKIDVLEKDITRISDDIKKLDIDDKNLSKIVIQLQTDQKYLERDFAIFKDELEK